MDDNKTYFQIKKEILKKTSIFLLVSLKSHILLSSGVSYEEDLKIRNLNIHMFPIVRLKSRYTLKISLLACLILDIAMKKLLCKNCILHLYLFIFYSSVCLALIVLIVPAKLTQCVVIVNITRDFHTVSLFQVVVVNSK